MTKVILATGKRKSAIARATLKDGSGTVLFNNISLDCVQPEMARLKLQEPLLLLGSEAQKFDISLTAIGGGIMGQVSAARLALARALVEKNEKFKEIFLAYDRQLLVADVRRKEQSKPNSQGNARAKRQKSYR
ncbi:MAG: 30S ribosomal protein S9 [Candidatus Nanoarchaeia archaeon]